MFWTAQAPVAGCVLTGMNEHSTRQPVVQCSPENLPTALTRRAFTLIEALVASAVVVALVILILSARAAGPRGGVTGPVRAVVDAFNLNASSRCQFNLQRFGVAMATYAADYQNVYAGANTSGAQGQVLASYQGNTTSSTPTQVEDWFSPTVGRMVELSPNRAERMTGFFNQEFACPLAARRNDSIFGNGTDFDDFTSLFSSAQGIRQVSYLSPAQFHYFPNRDVARANRYTTTINGQSVSIILKSLVSTLNSSVAVNPTFRPRLDLIGTQASNKVYVSDGTRYLDSTNLLSIEITQNPSFYGNFTDIGPIFDTSTAFGRRSFSQGAQLPLTFRHGAFDRINAVNFDGSVRSITQLQAWTDASPWYPSGSIFQGTGVTPEARAAYQTGDVIP